ncbi:phosphotransferase family protein [Lapidilactobacillus bayanensis]|uniref:phosphotransferase family protein n=1 Tax=Lapidilactobacillus bayanensis TaxID=2485998 RepID=UPI000F7B7096|nr:aminoglycoside phosphotransferase family protein [Lapidilactobacillus bayanensis]
MGSFLYQELTNQELTAIVQQQFKTVDFASKLMHGGLFNTTYQIKLLATGDNYVLRVGPINRQLLLPYEQKLMAAEVEIYQRLHAANIPCPTIVVYDESRTLLDRDYMIEKFVPAHSLAETTKTESQLTPLYQQLGTELHRMHAITSPVFGRVANIIAGIKFYSWWDYLCSEVDQNTELLLNHQILTPLESEQIKQIFQNAQLLFVHIKTASLVHADLWETNILVNEAETKIVDIIDADRALYGDPEFEFAMDWSDKPAIYEGYGQQPDQLPPTIKRRLLYQIVYCLSNTYVYFVEYDDPINGEASKAKLLKKVADFEKMS